jgi:molecular chaperone DnaJ
VQSRYDQFGEAGLGSGFGGGGGGGAGGFEVDLGDIFESM